LQAAWRHLSRVLRYNPNSNEVHQLLARVLVSLGELADAEKHLQQSAQSDPEMRLLLAAVYARQGKLDLAGNEARLADADLSKQLDAKQADAKQADAKQADAKQPDSKQPDSKQVQSVRLRLADAKVLDGDFAGAEQILAQIEQDEPNAAKVRLSQLYLAWYDALGRANGNLAERRALLQRALDAVPWNLPGIKRLLELSKQSPAEATWAAGVLAKLDWKRASAEALSLVGLDEWQSGHTTEARQHLEAAYRANPKDIRASNNLAWVLAHSDPPDLPRALELVTQALAQSPGQPNLLDTRGHILFSLHRWSDALGDLEARAAIRPQDKQLHEMLAECYAKLGMAELADFQRRLASNTAPPLSPSQEAEPADGP
jgi:tetratricopeptide (TPR) repeat protein